MIALTRATFVLVLAGLGAVSACSGERSTDTTHQQSNAPAPHSALGKVVEKAMDEARSELRTSNISLSNDDEKLPRAEITPQGALLIDGRPVATTPAQNILAMDYRTRLLDVAETGMDIGTQGADLAGKAMGEAFKGIFSGKSEDEIEKSIEAEAKAIEAAAARLCDRLPALLASERNLAAAVPEFAPYARMDDGDIDDCENGRSSGMSKAQRTHHREEVRREIRKGIRGSIQKVVQTTGLDSRDKVETPGAGEEDAAARN